jgi:protein-glutamine gamma-glutamyltransferase
MVTIFKEKLYMLKIYGSEVNTKNITNEYSEDSFEVKVIDKMASSKDTYSYDSLNQLKFELNMRKNIISSAIELNGSGIKFKVFKKSFCNPDFWHRTEDGGFKQEKDVTSSQAINDILKNGSKYGTECSTAIVILYYKAILNIYPEELFDRMFENLMLLNWHNFDDDLSIYSHEIEGDYLPGDCLYFENPDYNPEKQEWQGENVIDLGNNEYYGHGIGVSDSEHIIKSLNKHRKSDAKKSAYLTKYVARPNFMHLADIYLASLERMRFELLRSCPFFR